MEAIMANCGCANDPGQAFYDLGCIDCGTACCPACAVPLESVTYCRSCARSLLGAGTVQAAGSFDLQ
jgi:hypothetical protein